MGIGRFAVRFMTRTMEHLVKEGGRVKALQNLRYTTHERLMKAKTLDESIPGGSDGERGCS